MRLEKEAIFYPTIDALMLSRLATIDETIVREAEEFAGGLSGICSYVSMTISRTLGLKLEGGRFHVDKPYKDGSEKAFHYWCRDGLGRIVDLTASQFNDRLESPIARGVLIVNPENPLYKRYEPGTIVRVSQTTPETRGTFTIMMNKRI